MVEIHIGNVVSSIVGTLPSTVKIKIKEECAYSIQGAEFSAYGSQNYCPICKKMTANLTNQELFRVPQDGFSYRKCHTHGIIRPISLWDGKKYLFDNRNMNFPTGIIARVMKSLRESEIEYTIFDDRLSPITRRVPWHGPKLRYYQKEAVETLLSKTRGIVHASTGTGKSNILSAFFAETGVNTLILAHTTSVFYQLHENFTRCLKIPVGIIGDGKADIKKVTLAMPQSLLTTIKTPKRKLVKGVWKDVMVSTQIVKPELKDYLLSVEALYIDEAHRAACETVQIVANACVNAYYRVGVTATPYRADLLDILIESVTGKVGYKYTASQAIRDGFLSRPTIHFIDFKQRPYPKTITKTVVDKKTGVAQTKESKVTYGDLYKDRVVNNLQRNLLIAKIAAHHYKQGQSTLVIVRLLEHGINLFELLKNLGPDVKWVNGDANKEELDAVLADLRTGKCKLCIASGIFNEGIDVQGLNVCINTTACDSPVTAMQILGRTLRRTETKTEVDFYDIADTSVRWLGQHSASRLQMYQTEPEFIISHERAEEYLQ